MGKVASDDSPYAAVADERDSMPLIKALREAVEFAVKKEMKGERSES